MLLLLLPVVLIILLARELLMLLLPQLLLLFLLLLLLPLLPPNLNTHLVAHPNGAVVPVDEPAVAAARADHLATKGVYGGVYAAAGPVAYAAGYAPYAGLVAHPNGAVVPVDEPAVAAARADHLAAHGY